MKKKINIVILICLVLGIIVGILIPEFMNSISIIGKIYINLLKFIIIPILFTSIMVSIYKTLNKKVNMFAKTVIIFIIMFIVSFIITTIIVLVLNPNMNFGTLEEKPWNGEITQLSVTDIILNLFPDNIIKMFSSTSIFSIIVFAILCGICATKVEHGQIVIKIIEGLKNIFDKILEYIMYITPIAVFSLMGTTVANYGFQTIASCAKYILLAYICCIVVVFLVMILPVCIYAKISPIKYIKKVSRVWVISLSTCSSVATLPYTIKVCNEDFNIPSKITDIVVPLGCTIHMCGGAVSFALLGIFCSQLYGINITIGMYILMLISATLINMAAPGIPNGGIVIGATYLSILGIPLTFIGIYSGIYRVLDMAYTTLNVTGDVTANILINESVNRKELKN